MGTKDITEKNLEALNDVFADIVNVLLFKGERLVKEDELESDTTKSMFKADGKIHEQERDVSKFWKHGEIRISILGIENQTAQDVDMPLRVISYDGASYKQELLKDGTHRYPVVTMVLYFGTNEKWSAPKSLYECFSVPKKLKPFVSNYKINVFNIAWLSDKTIDMFTSDFKLVAKYFQTKRLHKRYEGSKERLQHANETLKMFSALTGDDSFEKVYNENNFREKGGVTMCDVVEQIRNEGRAEGRTEGRFEGKEEIIRNLIESNAGSIEQIAAWVKLPVEDVKKIAEKVPVMN